MELRGNLLANAASVKMTYSGTGMLPFLTHGDVLQIEKCLPEEVSFGDVIVYQSNDRFLVNRLLFSLKRSRSEFRVGVIKGDNRRRYRKVRFDGFTGTVAGIYASKRYINFRTPPMRLFFAMIGCLSAVEGILYRTVLLKFSLKMTATALARFLGIFRYWIK